MFYIVINNKLEKMGVVNMKKRNIIKWTLFTLLILFIIVGAYIFSTFQKVKNSYDNTQITLNNEHVNKEILESNKAISFLVLGVDEREGDRGRSDTILVGAINPNTDEGILISVPRDLRVKIPTIEGKDKINHAYAFGGSKLATETVENLFDLSINFVATTNMEGFSQLIDLVGGITVNNNNEFTYNGQLFEEGDINLSSTNALDYIKMRKDDPEGDFGRQKRQKAVLNGLVNELSSSKSVLDLTSISTIIGNNLETNVQLSNVQQLQQDYLDGFKNSKQVTFTKGQDKKIEGIYYYEANKTELQSITKQLHSIINTTK